MKPTAATTPRAGIALGDALDRMSYQYLATNAPDLIMAIDTDLRNGMEPEGIRFFVQRWVGVDRENLALRCEQAARYMATGRVTE